MRYYFHLYNDVTVMDEEGAELPDVEAARRFALTNIRELIGEQVQEGRLNLSHRIEVEDENGGKFTVPFRDAISIED